MITEQDIQRVTSEQEVYENTLESMVSKLEREKRYLEGRVRYLESQLERIRVAAIAGIDQ